MNKEQIMVAALAFGLTASAAFAQDTTTTTSTTSTTKKSNPVVKDTKAVGSDMEKGAAKVGHGVKKSVGYVGKETEKAGGEIKKGLEKVNPIKGHKTPKPSTTTPPADSTAK
jgi:hypothetical protein